MINPHADIYMRKSISMNELTEYQRLYGTAEGDFADALDRLFDKVDLGQILIEV